MQVHELSPESQSIIKKSLAKRERQQPWEVVRADASAARGRLWDMPIWHDYHRLKEAGDI